MAKNCNKYSMVCAILLCATSIMSSPSSKAKEIYLLSVDKTKVEGSEASSTLIIYDEKGNKRVRKLHILAHLYDHGKTEKKVIHFESPADVRGTAFLSYDYETGSDDKWIYIPALRKCRRIVSSENARSFFGSEFSYADMSNPDIDAFEYYLLPEERIENDSFYVVEIKPKNEESKENYGFSKKVQYINKNNHLQKQSIYYDLSGNKEKTLKVLSVIEVDKDAHKYRLSEIEIENHQNKRRSLSIIDKIELRKGLSESKFTVNQLGK
ncbi:MAG: outer membrane lipoprotein-sorting protein [Bacteroidales bacterium]|nr:outer membrane lipoprotein-sorting protein [Bacteroidales bacterium]